jgi:hypothetical protein
VHTPKGGLLFVSRDGGARDGKATLAEYDPDQGGWSSRWEVTSSEGLYVFGDKVLTRVKTGTTQG